MHIYKRSKVGRAKIKGEIDFKKKLYVVKEWFEKEAPNRCSRSFLCKQMRLKTNS